MSLSVVALQIDFVIVQYLSSLTIFKYLIVQLLENYISIK